MFRKDAKALPKPLGISYIVAQIIGAFLAALVLVFFTNN
jgi:glycerol uptake facilitator-like aquaporin